MDDTQIYDLSRQLRQAGIPHIVERLGDDCGSRIRVAYTDPHAIAVTPDGDGDFHVDIIDMRAEGDLFRMMIVNSTVAQSVNAENAQQIVSGLLAGQAHHASTESL